jgi:hypothetical protein
MPPARPSATALNNVLVVVQQVILAANAAGGSALFRALIERNFICLCTSVKLGNFSVHVTCSVAALPVLARITELPECAEAAHDRQDRR